MSDEDIRAENAELERAVEYYIAEANRALAAAAEQRARRLELEEELPFAGKMLPNPTEPLYVERKVYTPMPPREIKRIVYVDRPIERHTIIHHDREPTFFGRVGDCLDHFLARWL